MDVRTYLESAISALKGAMPNPLEALKWTEEARKLDPSHLEVNHIMGISLAMLDRVEEALAALRRELSLHPENSNAKELLRTVVSSIATNKQFGKEAIWLLEQVSPGDVVIDVGSNVGDFTDLFLAAGASVISIEPCNWLADHQRNRFHSQSKEGRFELVNVACSDKEGSATLYISKDESAAFSSLDPNWQPDKDGNPEGTPQNVLLKPLRDILKDRLKGRTPKVLKMDVEGHELTAFKGLFPGDSSLYPDNLMFEFHTNPEILERVKATIGIMKDAGYVSFQFYIRHGHLLLFSSAWLSPEEALGFDLSIADKASGEIPQGYRYGNVLASKGKIGR